MAKRSRIKDFLWRHSAGIAFSVMVSFVALIGFVGYTYAVITKKFDSSRRWDLPSRIYSDATPIVPGTNFKCQEFVIRAGFRMIFKSVRHFQQAHRRSA